jgi:hypothetical protein
LINIFEKVAEMKKIFKNKVAAEDDDDACTKICAKGNPQ